MAMGETRTGLTNDIGLDIPAGAPLTKDKGTVGAQLTKFQNVSGVMELVPTWVSHSPGSVMQWIEEQSTRYGKYIPEVWDCEDWAYLAAADVRRKFAGQPVGILIGKGKFGGPNIVGKEHAINILWFEKNEGDGKKVWYPRYYDATWKKDITDMAGGDPPFDTEIIVPCPIGGSENSKDYKEFPPYENYPFLKTATLALDRTDYDFSAIDDVKRMLTEWNSTSYGIARDDSTLFTQTDLAFYYFAHIRRWYANIRQPSPKKALPVGLVVGKIASSGNDIAALVLWKSDNKNDYIYWGIYNGEQMDPILKKVDPIKPRVIMV